MPESFWIDVPTDCFGGVSPERKAADALSTLVTSVSVRTIMAQEKENDGESKVFTGLAEAVQNPMRSTERCVTAAVPLHLGRVCSASLNSLICILVSPLEQCYSALQVDRQPADGQGV